MTTLLIFIVTLGVLVLVHELGHFLAARFFKMGIEEFAVGFPPRVYKKKSEKTGIVYSVGAIPIGGYVKIAGQDAQEDETEESKWKKEDLFMYRPLYQRIIVLTAGVAMNFIFASVVLALVAPHMLDPVPQGADDVDAVVLVTGVSENSIAARANIPLESQLIGIHDTDIRRARDVIAAIDSAPLNKDVAVTWKTLETNETQTATVQFTDPENKKLGIGLVEGMYRDIQWYEYPYYGIHDSAVFLREMVRSIGQLIGSAFGGERVEGELYGPVGIAQLVGQFWDHGYVPFLRFVGVLSLNLFLINILPIPALDGGRVVMAIIDRLSGGTWSEMSQARVNQVGFLLLLGLIFVFTVKDILRFFQ